MKRIAALTFVTALFALLFAQPAAAACVKPPGRSSPEGRLRIRTHSIVVSGFVDAEQIPSNAHGVYSFSMVVSRYFAGSGPTRILITNYGNLESDLHSGYERPNNRTSRAATVDFLRRFAGQKAIMFLTPGDNALGKDTTGRYKGGYSTNSCLYNVVGTKDYDTFFPLLTRIFSAAPPTLGATPTPRSSGGGKPAGGATDQPRAGSKELNSEEGRSGPIVRAAALIVLVGAGLLAYRNPRSPLFERWRSA